MVVCKSGVGVNSMLELLFESRVCPGALWHTEEREGEPSAGLTVATTDQSCHPRCFLHLKASQTISLITSTKLRGFYLICLVGWSGFCQVAIMSMGCDGEYRLST